MHEMSVMDKEKEHMSRLQDAEEMKVSAAAACVPQRASVAWESQCLLLLMNSLYDAGWTPVWG